jgi:hypothetical protein
MKLSQSKWLYVPVAAVVWTVLTEPLQALIAWDPARWKQLPGRMLVSALVALPFALVWWHQLGPGSRPAAGVGLQVDPAATLEVQTKLVHRWQRPIVGLMTLAVPFALVEMPVVALLVGAALAGWVGYAALQQGRLTISPTGVTLQVLFCRFSLAWSEVTAVESKAEGTYIALISGRRRLPVPVRMFWFGPDRFRAGALLDHHLAARNIPITDTWRAVLPLPIGGRSGHFNEREDGLSA